MIVFSFGLMIVSLFRPNIGHIIVVVITLSGLVYYFPFVYFKLNVKFLSKLIYHLIFLIIFHFNQVHIAIIFFKKDKLSQYLQIFLNVISETSHESSDGDIELEKKLTEQL